MFDMLFKKKESPQYDIRLALTKLMATKHTFISLISKDMGVDRLTLTHFLKDEKDVEFTTLIKIVDYIEKNKD